MSTFRDTIRRNSPAARHEVCDLKKNPDETMDDFERESKKALWHAFDMLDTKKAGFVAVSQLKVITSNIGLKLGFEKAEEILNKDGITSLDFDGYFEIVHSELLKSVAGLVEHGGKGFGERLNDIAKTCWAFCTFSRHHKSHNLSSEHCLILWRLFNVLSETNADGNPSFPVKLDPEEASILLKEFIETSGQRSREHFISEFMESHSDYLLTFTDFLNMFEKEYVTNLSKNDISHGLNQLYDTYILNIIGKGMMWKSGHKYKSWKERWLVLTPKKLMYYVGPNEKVLKGHIEFDTECRVEIPADRPTHKPNRFIIHTPKKPYDMSAPDSKTKNEWISGVQMALDRIGHDPNIQKENARKRCIARAEKRKQAEDDERKRREEAELLLISQNELDEEKRKRLEDENLLRERLLELEEEKRRRADAEARFAEEQLLREAEQERLRELEAIKRELERLLAEERQAKKDEEIVRNLQARLLEEEFEKREELEKLKQQQEQLLMAEREQKAVLIGDKKEQERLLQEAQQRLDQLERDRTAAADKMQEATEKLLKAERDRHKMEEKVKLWKTPVGLARPILPHPEPMASHRGLGAFCSTNFLKKSTEDLSDKTDANNEDTEKGQDSTVVSKDKTKILETKQNEKEEQYESHNQITEEDAVPKLTKEAPEVVIEVKSEQTQNGEDTEPHSAINDNKNIDDQLLNMAEDNANSDDAKTGESLPAEETEVIEQIDQSYESSTMNDHTEEKDKNKNKEISDKMSSVYLNNNEDENIENVKDTDKVVET